MNLNIKGTKLTAGILVLLAGVCIFYLSAVFLSMRVEEPIYPGPGVTEIKMLSDYFPGIDKAADTKVFILGEDVSGPSVLVLGGTHPNEPSGYLSAVLLIENAVVENGRMFVIPRTNLSAFTCNDPQEASPMNFTIETPTGPRIFRYGSRATNPVNQWPDPEMYLHSSGQALSGSETRNINRTYPGRANGNFTEKVSYAITTLIKKEKIDITIDLHEAAPEYPTIDAIVAHENAADIASLALINMQLDGVDINLEPSPQNLHGLTHRELGDFTDTKALLMETANPAQGRLRGKTNESLVVNGTDGFYVRAAKYGRLYVGFDENGHPLDERVARHITGIMQIVSAYNDLNGEAIIVTNVPEYGEIINGGMNNYLQVK